jgi:hypothetical protein
LSIHNFQDYLVQSGKTYQYTVTQTGINSGIELESPVGYKAGTIQDTSAYLLDITQYWIIDPINPTLSTRIPNVTNAPMTENYEEELYTLIGRGQKKEYGTRLGFSGNLDAQIRGTDGTPALIRAALETMRAAQGTYYLRTPFGDLIMIALGPIQVTPIAGVGSTAMYDVSIPFDEVSGEIIGENPI